MCSGVAQEAILLAVVNKEKLVKLLEHILDENKFLSPYGIRSLSKVSLLGMYRSTKSFETSLYLQY